MTDRPLAVLPLRPYLATLLKSALVVGEWIHI